MLTTHDTPVKELTAHEALLVLTQDWSIADPENFISSIEDEPDTVVHQSVLESQHPLLAVAVRAMIEHDKPAFAGATKTAGGQLVCDTLQYLVHGGIQVTAVTGDVVTFCQVDELVVLPELNSNNNCIRVGGIDAKVQYTEHNGVMVPYITESNWSQTYVSLTEMDEQFPGWYERYKVASGLGLGDVDLGFHVFSKTTKPTLPATMPQVTFE